MADIDSLSLDSDLDLEFDSPKAAEPTASTSDDLDFALALEESVGGHRGAHLDRVDEMGRDDFHENVPAVDE